MCCEGCLNLTQPHQDNAKMDRFYKSFNEVVVEQGMKWSHWCQNSTPSLMHLSMLWSLQAKGVLNVSKFYGFKEVSGFQGCWIDEASTAKSRQRQRRGITGVCVLARLR